jgi:hypothetical protein
VVDAVVVVVPETAWVNEDVDVVVEMIVTVWWVSVSLAHLPRWVDLRVWQASMCLGLLPRNCKLKNTELFRSKVRHMQAQMWGWKSLE